MTGYETIGILDPNLIENEVQDAIDRYSKIITDNGGEVHKTGYWGLRKLAYKVKKQDRGHIIYHLFTAEKQAIDELERNFRISEQHLRYMTIKVDSVEETAKDKPQLLEDPALALQEGRYGEL